MKTRITLAFLLLFHVVAYAIKPEKAYRMTPSDLEIRFEEHRIKTVDGAELISWVMEPDLDRENGKAIIICGSDAGNMGYTVFYAKNLVELGYKVISFDYRGFGDSTDFEYNPNNVYHSEYITDFATVLTWSKENIKPESIGVFGLSMGTLVANLGYQKERYDFFIGEAFLWSPSKNRQRILELKQKELNLPEHSIQDEELVVQANVPTLLFAGNQDEITTLEDSREFCATRADSRVIEFAGGHLRGIVDVGVEEYFRIIDQFISDTEPDKR